MNTVYAIIDRSHNYDYHSDLSLLIAEKLETTGISKTFAVRASVHLASMYNLAFSLLRQIELFKITDDMPTIAERTLIIWEFAQSIKFHADVFNQQAQEITSFIFQPEDENEDIFEDRDYPSLEDRVRTNQWFKDRYHVIERAVSHCVPRLIAVRWTHNLLELGDDLFNLVDKLDSLTAKTTKNPEEIKNLWLDISFNWTTAGEGALIHLGNYTATGLDRIDPGLIGWSLVLLEEMRIEGLRVI